MNVLSDVSSAGFSVDVELRVLEATNAVRSAPTLVAFFDNVKDRLGLAIPVGSHEHLDTRPVFHVFELGNFLARLVGAPVELVLWCL